MLDSLRYLCRWKRTLLILLIAFSNWWGTTSALLAQGITREEVVESIDRARRFLLEQQQRDGAWRSEQYPHTTTVLTSFTLLALLNTGMTATDEPIERGLNWLRRQDPDFTNELSLILETLAAADQVERDLPFMQRIARKLESGQSIGANDGSWSYENDPNAQQSPNKAHFAALGLYEAAKLGLPVHPDTWRRAWDHWMARLNADGGWGSQSTGYSRGGVTAAGIAYLSTTQSLLRAETMSLNPDGTLNCCGDVPLDATIETACRWLGDYFSVTHNPSRDPRADGSVGYLYYLYCLERVGRLTGRRYFESRNGVRHDWYAEGARYLVDRQSPIGGEWVGAPHLLEDCPILATDYVLIFLSRGLSPLLAGKLQLRPDPTTGRSIENSAMDRTPNDAWNLAQFASRSEGWPKLLTWQAIDLADATLQDLTQAPLLIVDVADAESFSSEHLDMIREYLQSGGFLFALGGCRAIDPDASMQQLLERMYPGGTAELVPLSETHPVYRSQFDLAASDRKESVIPLWGVDTACRLTIIYSREDLACLWDRWSPIDLPNRNQKFDDQINQALETGVNVAAYAVGRELVKQLTNPVSSQELPASSALDHGLLSVAQVRYAGDWDAAPHALRHLLQAVNHASGSTLATEPKVVELSNPDLFNHPLLYLHGSDRIRLSQQELEAMRTHLENGGMLFADACCGASVFDSSFRGLVDQLFPGKKLHPIPPDHQLYSAETGYELREVRLRKPFSGNAESSTKATLTAPALEGLEIDGRLAIIYSRHDISCAVQRGNHIDCPGYVAEDAVKIGMNILWYSMLQ